MLHSTFIHFRLMYYVCCICNLHIQKENIEVPIQANRLYLAYTDINFFLIQNILRQDEKNNLFIHSKVLNTIKFCLKLEFT